MNSDASARRRNTHCVCSFEREPNRGVKMRGFLGRNTELERIKLVDIIDETSFGAVVISRLILATVKYIQPSFRW